MPDNNDILLDLISQSIRIEKPNLPDDQLRKLASDVKNIFESLNNGVMQLEDVTQSIVSVCLDLVNKTGDIINNNKILISSYDLIIEKIDDVAASISNRLRKTDILFRQNLEIKDIVDRNLDYISKLPDKLIKSMESAFERSTTLVTNSISQNIVKIADKIINSFKIFENFMRNPFKIVKDYVFTFKDQDENFLTPGVDNIFNRRSRNEENEKNKGILTFLKNLQNNIINKNFINGNTNNQSVNKFDELINEKTLAGITNIPLNEQIVLNKTAPGVAAKWLAKRLEKSGLVTGVVEEGKSGVVSNIKDKLLEGLGLAGGIRLGTMLPKMIPAILTTLTNPLVLAGIAAALGGTLLWKFRKPVGDFFDDIKNTTSRLAEDVKITIGGTFDKIKDIFAESWEFSVSNLKRGWDWVTDKWNIAQDMWSKSADSVKDFWSSTHNLLSNAVDSVKDFWSNIGKEASNIYDKTILPLLKDIDNLFGGVFSTGIEEIKKLKPYLDDFSNWVSSFKDNIVDFTINSGKKFLDWLKDIKDAVVSKDLGPGGIMGSMVGREARKLSKEVETTVGEKNINIDVNLDSALRKLDTGIMKPSLNRNIGEEVAVRVTYDILKNVEAGNRYSAVNRNDAGAVSLGTLQWRANRARDYLRNLYNVDPKLFRTTMGNKIVADLENQDWSNRTFSREESRRFAKLLEDSRMKAETDRLALQDISKYFKQAKELGIQDYRSLSIAASMINQHGFRGFKRLLEDKLQTTDFDKIVQIIKQDRNFPYRTRRLEEIEQLNNIYRDIKFLKEDLPRTINIPDTLESYNQSVNSVVVNEIKSGLQNISKSFSKSIDELKTEIKETKNKNDDRGMVESPVSRIDRSYINDIPKYIMEMMFGLNIGGEDKKLGGIF